VSILLRLRHLRYRQTPCNH